MLIRVLIRISVCDLDVELNLAICVGACWAIAPALVIRIVGHQVAAVHVCREH